MFQRFKKFQLYVNLKKYAFVIIEIEFLSFVIFIENVRINKKRIRIIKK